MFSHIMLGSNDPVGSAQFYDAVLGALGAAPHRSRQIAGTTRYMWTHQGLSLMVAQPKDGQPSTHYNGFTLGLAATSVEQVQAAYAAALAHGGIAIEDPMGWRQTPDFALYLAYVRDPAGHKLCFGFKAPKAQA